MKPVTLEELLDRSSPPTVSAMHEPDLRAAILDARHEAVPKQGNRKRIGWLVTAASVVGVGILGGAAWAATLMPQGFDDRWDNADYTTAFSLPSGRECELRVMVADSDGGRSFGQKGRGAARWLSETDLWSGLDFDSARDRDAELAAADPSQTVILDSNGRVGDAQVSPSDRTADDVFVNVVSIAVAGALDEGLSDLEIEPGEVSVLDSVRCDAVNE
jgi:hypothetical protein